MCLGLLYSRYNYCCCFCCCYRHYLHLRRLCRYWCCCGVFVTHNLMICMNERQKCNIIPIQKALFFSPSELGSNHLVAIDLCFDFDIIFVAVFMFVVCMLLSLPMFCLYCCYLFVLEISVAVGLHPSTVCMSAKAKESVSYRFN